MPPRGTAPRTIAAAHAVDDTNVSAIPALDGPAALSVAGLDAPAEVPLRSIVPEPMRVRALELDPLTTTPPDRREE
jgi:hypothetical protein